MKTLSMDIVRVTEAAAIAASKLVCSGDKLAIDKAATDAMRRRLNKLDFAGLVVIGEGKKDEADGLFQGEYVGKGGLEIAARLQNQWVVDDKPLAIAVDPVDGTTQTSIGGPEAMSVLAVAESNGFYSTPHHYMMKMAVGPRLANKDIQISITDTPLQIIRTLRVILGYTPVVCLLNRPRHETLIKDYRDAGARIKLIQDCDVSAAIATCLPNSGIDLYTGIGGAPEAVLAAAAIKCLKGNFTAWVVDNKTYALKNNGYLSINDLVGSECLFCATGITNGSLLRGVKFNHTIQTNSVFMRSESGTIRWIETHHGN